jgi:hypothetical protein
MHWAALGISMGKAVSLRGAPSFSPGRLPKGGLSLEGCPGMKQAAKSKRMDFQAWQVAPVQLWVRRPMMHCGNAGGKNHYHNS